MNFLNRAFKNVTRGKTKSILLAVTFFLIGNLVIIGLGVSYASENAKKLTRQKMKPVITYEVDYDSFYKWVNTLESEEEQNAAYENFPRVKKADFEKLLDNEHIEVANVLISQDVYAGNFSNVQPEKNENEGGGGVVYDEMGSDGEYVYVERNIKLTGNGYPNMIELVDGTYEIKEGRFYSEDDIKNHAMVAVIEERLATANNLKVGDHITVNLIAPNSYESQSVASLDPEALNMDLEIIGIYANNTVVDENQSWMLQMPSYMPANLILVPATAMEDYFLAMSNASWDYYASMYPDESYYSDPNNRPTADSLYNNFVLLLDDPLYVDEFKEVNKENLLEYTFLNANDELFNKFAKPLDTMSLFSDIIVWIVVINAVVIISLVTALTMKNREQEIGILLSIGVSKLKIVSQLFVELAAVAIIGFTLAVVSGSLMAKGIGQAVLDYQLTNSDDTSEDNYYYYGDNNYFTNITQDDMLSEYQVSINPVIIAEIYALGLGVVFVSIMIPSFMIMRFNPKKILTNTY